jgi:hypothetical protein
MAPKVCRLFAIDSRSLAAFRAAMGLILLADVAIRAGDFSAHYTEDGVLPLAALREWFGSASWRWSLYTLLPASWWPAVLLGLTALCGGLLVLGLWTRFATVAAWILTVSLHNRMPLVINAGDTLLHVFLFWGMFLPLGATCSVDAALRRRRGQTARGSDRRLLVFSAASAAILIQVATLYISSGVFKLGNADWHSGLSLYYVMSFDAYARGTAAWLLQHPDLLRLLTWATVALEIGGPVAAFCPWFTAPLRLVIITAFVAFHLGIEATMTVGLFSWVSIAGWLLFLPSGFWESLTGRLFPLRREGAGEEWRRGGIVSAFAVLPFLALTLYWNASGFRAVDKRHRPAWCRAALELSGLRQEWRMFTRPPKHDGWPRVAAKLTDGRQWDLLEDEPGFDWRRRDLPSAIAPNHRWRKYYSTLTGPNAARLRSHFCQFLARQFEARRLAQVAMVRLYRVEEVTGLPGEEPRLIRKLLHQETIRTQGAFVDAAESGDDSGAEIHPGI